MTRQVWQARPLRLRRTLAVLPAICLLLAQVSASAGAEDPFFKRYDSLRRQDAAKVGRETIIAGYQKLIADYPNDPRIADAMFDIASRLENSNPATGMKAEPAEAIAWYRKAAEAAAPTSELWAKARLFVARRISYKGPDGVAEARTLLEEVTRADRGDSYDKAQLEQDWMSQSFREMNLAEVERHSLNLLNWYQDPQHIPKDDRRKRSLDFLIASAGNGMIQRLASMPLPEEERKRRIEELVAAHPDVQGLADVAKLALPRVEIQRLVGMPLPKEERKRLIEEIVAAHPDVQGLADVAKWALQRVEQSPEPRPAVAPVPVPGPVAAAPPPGPRSAARPQPYSSVTVFAIVSVVCGLGLIIGALLIRAKRSRADT